MDLKTQQGMVHSNASCPDCQKETLYCGKIESKIGDLNRKEILFCKSCKFVIPVAEFKKMLFSK
ncbi:MAG: hypothetical protein PVG43_06055 [Nitrosopumilaceae archaeon]|jgi:hypothetical protein